MKSNRSRNAVPQTPSGWEFVNIVRARHPTAELYHLTVGINDSLCGFQTCKAAGIPNVNWRTLDQAITDGTKLDAWLKLQETKGK